MVVRIVTVPVMAVTAKCYKDVCRCMEWNYWLCSGGCTAHSAMKETNALTHLFSHESSLKS
eukprot:7822732-Ditylum_brightwellii.AAC.1